MLFSQPFSYQPFTNAPHPWSLITHSYAKPEDADTQSQSPVSKNRYLMQDTSKMYNNKRSCVSTP